MIDSSFEKAIKFYAEKKYELALKELLKTDNNLKDNPDLSYYLGLCYTKLKQFDEAIIFLEQVITTHTNVLYIYQCRMILSYIYAITEQFKLAEHELKRLIEDGYESVQVYCSFGYVQYQQGKVENAMDFFQKALTIDGEHPTTLNSIGYILADEEIDPDKAVQYCSKAVEKVPDYYPFLDSLGWALFKAGKSDEALECLRNAFELSKGNKVIAKHLKETIDSRK
ncbi:MAG: tetratricopeptide repeat protein [Spirochaetaceae bacterium]|nr:tetratricopeptide repeat protein [Spirochaetaceae bacterium]